MITNEWLYWIIGTFFIVVAVLVATAENHPKRLGTSAFWGLLGASFFYGTYVANETAPAWILGIAVLIMVVLAGFGFMAQGTHPTSGDEEREASARKYGSKLFIPALTVPVITAIIALAGPLITVGGKPLLAEGSATLTGLGVGAIVGLIVAYVLLRPVKPAVPFREGTRLLEAIGWAALLPQMLSTLGTLFTKSGVGEAVGSIFGAIVPEQSLLGGVIAYCFGMAIFTVIMGNAFAAFPIMTAAVGWPVLVEGLGGNPAAIFAMGMLAGFCGTLCTPMAANFNIVPAALLEMKNKNGVIAVQIPSAVLILIGMTVVMYFFAFPG